MQDHTLRDSPSWLTVDHVILINRREVAETGEIHFIRDAGLLQSAADRPKNIWSYTENSNIVVLATAIIAGIAQNHPFEQGNKRTALTSGLMFAGMNGYGFNYINSNEVGYWVESLVNPDIDEDQFTLLLSGVIGS